MTVQTSSNADFVASYTKIGSATITFVAGSGATLVQLSGTAALTGSGLLHHKDTKSINQHQILIKDPAIIYTSLSKVPAASKEMKDLTVTWVQDKQLPKLPNQQPPQQTISPQKPIQTKR